MKAQTCPAEVCVVLSSTAERRPSMTHILTVFLSAILLFQIQPMIAKAILPWFGGAAAVWTTCMLFFQVVLLLGYVYAHWLIKLAPLRWQVVVHLAVIGASLFALPVTPDPHWRPGANTPALSSLLLLLATTIGGPYFVLSTTTPLVQAWLARTSKAVLPYRLFAVSNIASLIGLVAYPFAVEPAVNIHAQLSGWSVGYVIFALSVIVAAAQAWRHAKTAEHAGPEQVSDTGRIGVPMWILWISLPACASALLVSATNYLCQDVAPVPFLWLLPLVCYLATFVLCFGPEGWYRPALFRWALAPVFAAFFFMPETRAASHIGFVILTVSGVVFFGCVFCHGELVRLKPDPSRLTSFYFALALGGAMGGAFVSVVGPMLYPTHVEIYVSIIACAFLTSSVAYRGESNRVVAAVTSTLMVAIVAVFAVVARTTGSDVVRTRNFYGALRIEDRDTSHGRMRSLIHGSTVHGTQFLAADGFRSPTAYYGRQSGIGMALSALSHAPRRVGVVGLGAGTLAAYASENDYFRFYEINPEIQRIALASFDYLPRCRGRYDVVLGDARLSLKREERQDFDLLALDAFSGDSVPVHLLTVEAFRVYARHLKPDGALAVHVSNSYLDLTPVVSAAAAELTGMQLRVFNSASDESLATSPASWVVITSNPTITASAAWQKGKFVSRTMRPWTDDYSNLFRIVKW